MTDQLMNVYIDFLPNQPKSDQSKEEIATLLKGRFEQRLPGAVDRNFELPPIMLLRPGDIYIGLLLEARELFVAGHFYSCVAMCGIVGERLVKDAFRTSVLISKNGSSERPTEAAFDQLEHIEAIRFIEFLKKTGLLETGAADAAKKLGELRNNYAHARGKNPEADAANAIKLLHALVEGTVSVFKEFEIKEGRLAPKTAPPKVGS
jgi:hypothetical protein